MGLIPTLIIYLFYCEMFKQSYNTIDAVQKFKIFPYIFKKDYLMKAVANGNNRANRYKVNNCVICYSLLFSLKRHPLPTIKVACFRSFIANMKSPSML